MDKLYFQYRPAPSQPVESYAVDEASVFNTQKGQTAWEIRFVDIDRVHYAVRGSSAGLSRTFIVYAGDKVQQMTQIAQTADDDVHDGFTALMQSVAARLETTQPGFRIDVGLLPKTKMAMFAAFGFAFVVGAGILIAMAIANLGFDDVLAVGLPLIGLMLCGVGGMWAYWPWRQPRTVAAKTFLKRSDPKAQSRRSD